MAAILRVRQSDGSWLEIPAIIGETPRKGEDYWTEADKAEIVNEVKETLATWKGGSY